MGDMYVSLAERAISEYVATGEVIGVPANYPDLFREEAKGVFVSIKKGGKLRGCIGTYEPQEEDLGSEIIINAIKAATSDPRFPPIKEAELGELGISVDVLSSPEECTIEDLDPKKFGIIVEKGMRRGLLLPDLEGVDTVSEQLNIAKRKAGISFHEDVNIYRFTVERH